VSVCLGSTEESLKGCVVIIFMVMRVLKLMDISYFREVLFIYVLVNFQLAEAFEYATVWFVYFH
jgi:hypothetical protein